MELTDLNRRKARRSGDNGGNCVEVAALTGATWHKARRSGDNGGSCVELAPLDGGTAVRDSKNPGGAVLAFTPREWTAFLASVKTGSFDLR
jgi:uncharacterized protein DUF397